MKRLDLNTVREIRAQLESILGDDLDDGTALDCIDGETDAGDILDRLIWNTQNDLHLIDALKEHEAALKARRSRMEARVNANKAAMLAVMDAAGVGKAERACATLTRRNGSASVHITDEEALPTQLCQIKRVPDKKAIKAQLDAGEDVPGAEIRIGASTITMRSA